MIRLYFQAVILCALLLPISSPSSAEDRCCSTENIILITLDGVRWQEVFQGVDKRFFDQKDFLAYQKTHVQFKDTFGTGSLTDRREKIFPFLWNVIGKQGQLYGNRTLGSKADITNKLHFSYPGYNEILTGFADPRINSNDKVPNPNWTFLEWLDHQKGYKGKTAAFGSWDVFPFIVNEKRSNVFTNAGFEDMDIMLDNPRIKELNELQKDTPSPWDTVGLDVFTFNFAIEYLKEKKPKALYISLGETDDFAHDGHYDQYILAAQRADKFISRIWTWVQNDPLYRNKTTLLITTDHGRGHLELEHWKHHGRFEYTDQGGIKKIADIPGDNTIWMAVIGPDTPADGEMKNVSDIKQSQIAATLMKFLGLKYQGSHKTIKPGEPIELMFK